MRGLLRSLVVVFFLSAVVFPACADIWLLYWGDLAEINITLGKGGVREEASGYKVNQETNIFTSDDEAVYAVFDIYIPARATKSTYKAVVEWYAPPDGKTLYRTETVSGLQRGYRTIFWRKLPIRNTEVAEKIGVWNVRVWVSGLSVEGQWNPGTTSLRASFRIAEPTKQGVPPVKGCLEVPEGASWRDVVALVRRSVVFIEGPTDEFDEKGNRLYAHGSGVIISPDGYVLTAAHVVEDITGPIHVLVEEMEWYEAVVVKKHPKWKPGSEEWSADLALLKIKGVSGLSCARLGDSDKAAPEDEIRILGYPRAGEFGLGLVIASGKVIGLRRMEGFSLLQFEASPFDKGHSGGPIINARGEVIGIAMGVETTELGVAHQLGVAINTAREILPPGIAFEEQRYCLCPVWYA